MISVTVCAASGLVYTVDFVELADLLCLSGPDSQQDQLSATNKHHQSTMQIRDFSSTFPAKASALCYLLQDSLGCGAICLLACLLGDAQDPAHRLACLAWLVLGHNI